MPEREFTRYTVKVASGDLFAQFIDEPEKAWDMFKEWQKTYDCVAIYTDVKHKNGTWSKVTTGPI